MEDLPKAPTKYGIWEHFTVGDGLPDMKVECIFEDSRGDMWFGFQNGGAARYRNDRFEVFSRRDGLASNSVFSIAEDSRGDIWFGTHTGLTRYDGSVFRSPDLEGRCSFLWGRCRDWQDRLWFGLERRPGKPPAIYCWDGSHLRLHNLDDCARPDGQSIHCIIVGDDGALWCGGHGLYCWDGRAQSVCDATIIESIVPRPDGTLLLGTWEGMCAYDGRQLYKVAPTDEGLADPKPQFHEPTAMLEDADGRLWVATYDGRILHADGEGYSLFHHFNTRLKGGFCLDRGGRLWVGTQGMGIYCYDSARFQVLPLTQRSHHSAVYCLAEDAAGTVWAGGRAGLARYDGTALHRVLDVDGGDLTDTIALLCDRQDRLWFSRRADGLYRRLGERLERLPETADLGLLSVENIVEDPQGHTWFGDRWSMGWGKYEHGRLSLFKTEEDCPYPTRIGALYADEEGQLWIGSSYYPDWDGLCRYDGETFARVEGISGVDIFALCHDGEKSLWIGTNEGLYCCDGDSLTHFSREDGLAHPIVTCMARRRDGVLVCGTEGGGICLYDGKVFQAIEVPGDPARNVVHAVHQDAQGLLWFATEGGLVRYEPRHTAPAVERVEVLADQTYAGDDEVCVPAAANRLRFRFKGASPHDRPSQLVYRYRLEGHERSWHQTRATQVEYPPLASGEYRLVVQAVDRDLNYSVPAIVSLTVEPDPRVGALEEALRESADSFIGQSEALRRSTAHLAQVADTDITVLVLGETGTGKGVAARHIHHLSQRRDGPLIQVNCGAMPDGLIESELFGHEKGAFTGAVSRKIGRFELADGGTLFLDEIGDLPLASQQVLLQVLQDGIFQRVGGQEDIGVDVRVVAATNRDLRSAMQAGSFREDLFYRISAFTVELPPLRRRREDIPLLVRYFAERFARHLDKEAPRIDPAAMHYFQTYSWPGNVRELEHLVQRTVLVCRDNAIRLEDLSGSAVELEPERQNDGFISLEEHEKSHIRRALEAANWVVYGEKGAARLLQIHPEKLRYRMKKYNLKKPT